MKLELTSLKAHQLYAPSNHAAAYQLLLPRDLGGQGNLGLNYFDQMTGWRKTNMVY